MQGKNTQIFKKKKNYRYFLGFSIRLESNIKPYYFSDIIMKTKAVKSNY